MGVSFPIARISKTGGFLYVLGVVFDILCKTWLSSLCVPTGYKPVHDSLKRGTVQLLFPRKYV